MKQPQDVVMKQPRILVVGAGIAGLALVRALRDQGLGAEVVERDPDWRTTGAGLYLPANAVRALERLGLGTELARRAHPVTRQRMLDHRGRALADFPVRAIWGGVGDCLAISRAGLHDLLRSAVGDSVVRLGTGVTSVDDAGTVTFADGSSETYDVVVGADGAGSAVRRSAFGGAEPRFLGQICWRFLAHEDPAAPPVTDWTVRLGSGGRTFLTVPLGEGRLYCYADVNSAEPVAPAGDWRALFADFAGPVPYLLEQGVDAYFAPLSEIDDSDWARPHAVLVGDAAHACSPSMAQGGAMALEDVLVLAELLGGAARAGAAARTDIGAVLAAYQARRADRVRWVLGQNQRRDKARNLPTPLRNLTLRIAGERLFKANHAPLHAEA
ncbi:FAD-dependent monooxygenase [Streptomyces sp. NPDC006638]|uniref:FAD-dependent monooxygenase n=1 Tax=Streptomyces sp. NPDC006638 TaxID=3157183 RepID=UPI0033A11392